MKPIYLDNAATSHPKPESVYLAVMETMRAGGSPGRGSYRQAMDAERLLFETRELLAELFNVPNSERFIFAPNATMAINQALFGLLKPGDRVVTTSIEHNAVARPLRALEDRGVNVVKVPADPATGRVDLVSLKQVCLALPTRLLVVNHCSNVIGTIQPLEQLGTWCRQQKILFMVDGSQTAGAIPIDVKTTGIDLFAAPGHKSLLGPQGTGFLYVAEGIELAPLIYGGTGSNSHSDLQPEGFPERLECGTLNLPGLAGLRAGLIYLQQSGIEQIRCRELELVSKLLAGLNNIKNLKIYGPLEAEQRCAVISFNLEGRDPAEVGYLLDQQKYISVRVGLHCAPDAHRTIGTYPEGTIRVSPGYATTDAEVAYFLEAIDDISQARIK
ncbi:MAG: aminotransferase class V-fold PLP-dependent enzyme [Deltaproteobacteria bacterium]|nr:aminotransferase class V-fold PLP-dependent enzyme [Deltaproteobacteria bacterium]